MPLYAHEMHFPKTGEGAKTPPQQPLLSLQCFFGEEEGRAARILPIKIGCWLVLLSPPLSGRTPKRGEPGESWV